MNKSYISPTKLSCLALVCMISVLDAGFNALILSIIVAACFVLGIAIVSILEKITNSHVRFVIYALIVSGIMTVLKIVFNFLGSIDLIELSYKIDFALLSCLALAIMPIYFMHKTTTKNYYLTTISTAVTFTFFAVIVGSVLEILGQGSIFGYSLEIAGIELLGSSFIGFILIAILCIIGTAIENNRAKKLREERLLIDKYKYIIRESQIQKLKDKKEASSTQVFSIGGNDYDAQ